MIDRKAFFVAWAFVAAMLAAAAWRVSLLPDWTHMPRDGLNGMALPPVSSAVLLIAPGNAIFFMVLMAVGRRLSTASDQDREPWRKWVRLNLIGFSAICTAMQAFFIVRSLGLFLTINPILFTRGTFVVSGLLLMAVGNVIPKLPWLGSRIWFFNLDPDRGAKLQRFRGWFAVLLGLFTVLGGLFLPLRLMPPIIFSMTAAGGAVVMLFRFVGKHGQPQ